MSFLFLLFSFFFSENGGVKIEKQLLYDRHTLEDNYEYRKVERSFQWDKIAGMIDSLLNFENQANGRAPLSDSSRKDAYRAIEDKYGVKRDQSVPFYKTGNWEVPERYGRDGALVSVIRDSAVFLLVTPSSFGGEWWVPEKYVDRLGGADFRKLIFIDRTNQNLATLEQGDSTWLVRSMNPITTGLHRRPIREKRLRESMSFAVSWKRCLF